MSRRMIAVTINLCSEVIISSGHNTPGGEDISLRLDAAGRPFLPGSTLKGLLRESMENLLVWEGEQDETILPKLFGTEGSDIDDARRLIFGMQRLCGEGEWAVQRTFTKLTEDRVAEPKTLRTASCLKRGLCFSGLVGCDDQDLERVVNALKAIKWIGLLRNRGFGRVKVSISDDAVNLPKQGPVAEAACLHYRLRLETPLTVGEMHGSTAPEDRKNYMNTRKYLPGSVMRGYVISQLAARDPAWFEAHKQTLLGNGIRFLNAFPSLEIGEDQFIPSIPTPAGFYEERSTKGFISALQRDIPIGYKRANMGEFCCRTEQDDSKLHCFNPRTAASLRILRSDEKQVFTTDAIAEGTYFDGYILLDDPALAQSISEQLLETAMLGADRFAGSGFCSVTKLEAVEAPHWMKESAVEEAPGQTLYMLLLSPMAMFKDGDPVGLDKQTFAEKLGVESVGIDRCATALTEVQGFNRKLGIRMPALPMYAAGSIFKLVCSTTPDAERLRAMEWSGLGVRRSEGFGQVLFLKNYEAIKGYEKLELRPERQDGASVRLRRAKAKWLLENCNNLPDGLSKSQIGSIQALCERGMFNGGDVSVLEEHFAQKAISPDQEKAFDQMQKLLKRIWDRPLHETLGLEAPVAEDSRVLRLELIVALLNLSRKGEERG